MSSDSSSYTPIEAVLRRDRAIVLAALLLLTALAWAYIIHLAVQMDMGGMDMAGFRMAVRATDMIMTPGSEPWSAAEFLFTLAMWAVMMVGMMTPSATPMILLYARVGRHAMKQAKPFAATGWFAGGYIAAWFGFSVVATTLQWALDRVALLTPGMTTATTALGGIVLIAAGIYQWTPLKDKCLVACQTPMEFITRHGGFSRVPSGAFRIGAQHGFYCVGCCWALMTLLFVGGIMNTIWISGIAGVVLIEKVVRAGQIVPRVAGVILAAAGVWTLL